jgi:hypothetical protein
VTTACGVSITLHHQMMHTLHCRVLIRFLNGAAYSVVNGDNSCTALVGVFPFRYFFLLRFVCESFYKKIKYCNLNIGFCTLHQEFISSTREFSVAVDTVAASL